MRIKVEQETGEKREFVARVQISELAGMVIQATDDLKSVLMVDANLGEISNLGQEGIFTHLFKQDLARWKETQTSGLTVAEQLPERNLTDMVGILTTALTLCYDRQPVFSNWTNTEFTNKFQLLLDPLSEQISQKLGFLEQGESLPQLRDGIITIVHPADPFVLSIKRKDGFTQRFVNGLYLYSFMRDMRIHTTLPLGPINQ